VTATVAGIHLSGNHAGRPAANTVPDGSLYSCSTHGLIYQSSFAGNSWATWATLGGTETLAASIIDAKGDLIAGTAADTASRLAVGSNGQVLTADSGEATGLKWATGAGGSSFSGASVYHNTTENPGANGKFSFNSEEFDVGGYHDPATNNSRLTAVSTGKHWVRFGSNHGTTDTPETWFLINNTTKVRGTYNATTYGRQVTAMVNLTAGDYIEVVSASGARTWGDASDPSKQSTFQIQYLGA
jgi:hypothetical protein